LSLQLPAIGESAADSYITLPRRTGRPVREHHHQQQQQPAPPRSDPARRRHSVNPGPSRQPGLPHYEPPPPPRGNTSGRMRFDDDDDDDDDDDGKIASVQVQDTHGLFDAVDKQAAEMMMGEGLEPSGGHPVWQQPSSPVESYA